MLDDNEANDLLGKKTPKAAPKPAPAPANEKKKKKNVGDDGFDVLWNSHPLRHLED